jgi:anti-anti-sigma regulatory factor
MPGFAGETTSKPADTLALTWQIKRDGDSTTVEFVGEIDENADFAQLRDQLAGKVVFHLGEVRRINSCGVREWVNFVRDLPRVESLVFSHCSPAIVTQLNMIYNFRGRARVQSFFAPYVCENCNNEEEKLLETYKGLRNGQRLPEFSCSRCQHPMEFDDLPERYLSFLHEE